MSLSNAIKEPEASHVYFVVRASDNNGGSDVDAAGPAEIVMQTMDTTWQAYNNYLAPSTYGVHPLDHHNMSAVIQQRIKDGAPARAYKTSYNRPFITRDVRSVNTVFNAEYPMIRFLESNGYDVSYVSGLDLHIQRGVSRQHTRLYISVGHDEYSQSHVMYDRAGQLHIYNSAQF